MGSEKDTVSEPVLEPVLEGFKMINEGFLKVLRALKLYSNNFRENNLCTFLPIL